MAAVMGWSQEDPMALGSRGVGSPDDLQHQLEPFGRPNSMPPVHAQMPIRLHSQNINSKIQLLQVSTQQLQSTKSQCKALIVDPCVTATVKHPQSLKSQVSAGLIPSESSRENSSFSSEILKAVLPCHCPPSVIASHSLLH